MRWVALVAAYLLAAHSLLGALALGVHAAHPPAHGSGVVLCTPGGLEAFPGDDDRPKPPHTQDCCIFGCGAAPLAVPAAHQAALPFPLLVDQGRVAFPLERKERVQGREGSPGNPRAPPLTAS